MKKILALLVVGGLLWVAPASAAITAGVSGQKIGLTTSTTIVTGSFTPTAGSLLVALCVSFTSTPTLSSIKLDATTSFTADSNTTDAGTTYRLVIASLPNVASGAHTVTATYGSALTDGNCWVQEFLGAHASTPTDATGSTGTGTSGAPSSGSFATTSGAVTDVYVGIFGDDSTGSDTVSAGTNYTLVGTAASNGATNVQSAADYRIQTALSTDAVTFTTTNSHKWFAAGMAYKVAAAGAACTPTLTLLGVGRCG